MTISDAIKILKNEHPHNPDTDRKRNSLNELAEALDLGIKALEEAKPTGAYQCFHCGAKAVTWDSDFDFDDMGIEGEGVVNCCHCNNCGAEIEYRVRSDEGKVNEDRVD